jgi:hypothetical protein
MKQTGKSDPDIATRLKDIQLTEELNHSAKTALMPFRRDVSGSLGRKQTRL